MEKIDAWTDCVSWDERPKTIQEGLRTLADWFDAVYQDAGVNDAVQQDLRKWASDVDALRAAVKGLVGVIKDAKQFIDNGIEYGYIRMPDPSTNDPASKTPENLTKAIAYVDKVLNEND